MLPHRVVPTHTYTPGRMAPSSSPHPHGRHRHVPTATRMRALCSWWHPVLALPEDLAHVCVQMMGGDRKQRKAEVLSALVDCGLVCSRACAGDQKANSLTWCQRCAPVVLVGATHLGVAQAAAEALGMASILHVL